MAGKCFQELAGIGVPELYGLILARGGDENSFRRKAGRDHRAGMSLERDDRFARARIPNPRCAVIARRDELQAVRREMGGIDRAFMDKRRQAVPRREQGRGQRRAKLLQGDGRGGVLQAVQGVTNRRLRFTAPQIFPDPRHHQPIERVAGNVALRRRQLCTAIGCQTQGRRDQSKCGHGDEPAPQSFRALLGEGQLIGLIALGQRAERDPQNTGNDLQLHQLAAPAIRLDLVIDGLGAQSAAVAQRQTIGFRTGPALRRPDPEIGGDGLAPVGKHRAVRADGMAQRLGKTFVAGGEPHGLFARIRAGIGLTLDHDRENPVAKTQLFEIADFIADIGGGRGPRRADHQQEPAGVQGAIDRRGEISIHRQLLLVAEDRKNTRRDRVAARIDLTDQLGRHLIGLDRLMQPCRPLATGLPVIGMAVGDETPIAAPVRCRHRLSHRRGRQDHAGYTSTGEATASRRAAG